jgi:hypothetical protein
VSEVYKMSAVSSGADVGDQGGGRRVDDDHARFGVGQDGSTFRELRAAVAGAHSPGRQSLTPQRAGDLAGPLVEFGERGQPARLGERDHLRGDGGPLPR